MSVNKPLTARRAVCAAGERLTHTATEDERPWHSDPDRPCLLGYLVPGTPRRSL